jgi:hypothetical protein
MRYSFQPAPAGGISPERVAACPRLGLFYEDDSNNRRWILKFADPGTIEQLDEVFVTVEPAGGSPKPTGKPLLFTYLRIGPNHP